MRPNVSLITLGVADLERAVAFYRAMGLSSAHKPGDEVAFFDLTGTVLGLWSNQALANEVGFELPTGPQRVALAHNVASPKDVDEVLAEAKAAGAQIVKPGAKTSWGGYSGYFQDPDDHLWEVAHNPYWSFTDDGRIVMPS